jgi:hypothetical protein
MQEFLHQRIFVRNQRVADVSIDTSARFLAKSACWDGVGIHTPQGVELTQLRQLRVPEQNQRVKRWSSSLCPEKIGQHHRASLRAIFVNDPTRSPNDIAAAGDKFDLKKW